MTKPTIYLDMDGVLVDFVSGAIEATGIDLTHDTWTEWDAYRLKGWTSNQFWASINERLYFWEDLQPYPWAEELLELCRSFGEVVFCSTPSRNPESASGKLTWLQQRGWLKNHDCILMKDKWRLAKPGTILIDDRQESCDLFSKRGKTICFPQPWNVHRWTRDSQDRLRAVRLLLNHHTLAEDTLKLYGSSVACIGRKDVEPNTGYRSRIDITPTPIKPLPFSPEDDGCVSCGALVVPGTAGCRDCNEYALEAVGAPRCLTEKQVFVMSYLAVRSHSFRTIEGFIDNKVMAAIHTDAEKLWDMLQKGLEKG